MLFSVDSVQMTAALRLMQGLRYGHLSAFASYQLKLFMKTFRNVGAFPRQIKLGL